jgi:hypothetical protein
MFINRLPSSYLMKHLEFSDRVREEILQNRDLLERIRRHFSGEELLAEFLGGANNKHYRIGRLDSGLWLATREPVENNGYIGLAAECDSASCMMDRYQSNGLQNVIEECIQKRIAGFLATSICIGVKYQDRKTGEDAYALIIEELTCGKTIQYDVGYDGDIGKVRGTDIVVRFDLPSDPKRVKPREEYFNPERMLVFK